MSDVQHDQQVKLHKTNLKKKISEYLSLHRHPKGSVYKSTIFGCVSDLHLQFQGHMPLPCQHLLQSSALEESRRGEVLCALSPGDKHGKH